ncbi:hypothetical protein ACHAWO_007711 [Cyclotella atomus]|uniref:Uncharacterized protein n=1 Tax=Cyclotella atomus TaxID=382360 RepID=A0ABD3NC63_9STRA
MSAAATDPLNIISTPNTSPTTCILSNITSRPALNGQYCQAVEFTGSRYTVVLFDAKNAAATIVNGTAAPQPQLLKVQPSSLSKASIIDQTKLSALVAIEVLKLYANHEKVLNFGRRVTPALLQGRISPKQMLGAIALSIGILSLFIGYIIGFTKLFLSFSLVSMLLMISSPDWLRGLQENKPMMHVVRTSIGNLGMRWKAMILQMTGYAVSDRMAAASLVVLVLWTVKLLITPAVTNLGTASSFRNQPQYDAEFMYKLGYEDGKSGDVFGASLPSDMLAKSSDTLEDLDYAYNNPPPPLRSKPNLGMGTLLSIFALFRFGRDLVTQPDGTLIRDVNLIMVKLRSYEPWRLGLIFMSLYRVVGALSSFFR